MRKIMFVQAGLSGLLLDVLERVREEFKFPDDSPHPICLVAVGLAVADQRSGAKSALVAVCSPDRLLEECDDAGVAKINLEAVGRIALRAACITEHYGGKAVFITYVDVDEMGPQSKESKMEGSPSIENLADGLIKVLQIDQYRTANNSARLVAMRDFLDKLKPDGDVH